MARSRKRPPKKLMPLLDFQQSEKYWQELGEQARYVGNPLHKKSPADFGLTPPSAARQEKTLCDMLPQFTVQGAKACAQKLLRNAFNVGLLSEQMDGKWPKNIWAIEDGIVLEAMLDDSNKGTYHWYPLQQSDPMNTLIKKRVQQ